MNSKSFWDLLNMIKGYRKQCCNFSVCRWKPVESRYKIWNFHLVSKTTFVKWFAKLSFSDDFCHSQAWLQEKLYWTCSFTWFHLYIFCFETIIGKEMNAKWNEHVFFRELMNELSIDEIKNTDLMEMVMLNFQDQIVCHPLLFDTFFVICVRIRIADPLFVGV